MLIYRRPARSFLSQPTPHGGLGGLGLSSFPAFLQCARCPFCQCPDGMRMVLEPGIDCTQNRPGGAIPGYCLVRCFKRPSLSVTPVLPLQDIVFSQDVASNPFVERFGWATRELVYLSKVASTNMAAMGTVDRMWEETGRDAVQGLSTPVCGVACLMFLRLAPPFRCSCLLSSSSGRLRACRGGG